MWDAMVEVTGRNDVPQRPDLIYQFLPVRWGTIGQAGVEFSDMTYDSAVLDPYRKVPRGSFRSADRAAPFYFDPHDLARVWFRDPQSKQVEPIEWRESDGSAADIPEEPPPLTLRQWRSMSDQQRSTITSISYDAG
jgi:putative transposase